jgi:hypothetical protein
MTTWRLRSTGSLVLVDAVPLCARPSRLQFVRRVAGHTWTRPPPRSPIMVTSGTQIRLPGYTGSGTRITAEPADLALGAGLDRPDRLSARSTGRRTGESTEGDGRRPRNNRHQCRRDRAWTPAVRIRGGNTALRRACRPPSGSGRGMAGRRMATHLCCERSFPVAGRLPDSGDCCDPRRIPGDREPERFPDAGHRGQSLACRQVGIEPVWTSSDGWEGSRSLTRHALAIM